MTKLLIVDDEANIRTMIRKYAVYEGYEAEEAADGMEAVELCRSGSYDLIIMDVMMPELDGFSAVKDIRKFDSSVPVIMLSALGEEYDRIHGFDVGVDDYVVKPFSGKELMMRVRAILKRTGADSASDGCFAVEGLVVDDSARIVTIDGERAA
ncbi:MAG: response regulator transcription factor, partial [Solobacterium sp.]|nr:response regulator transcription factor [Solobacterium sp.]